MYKLSNHVRKIKFAREAGAVRRLHVHRVIGSYDVAQHTYGALCLLKLLHPNPPIKLIWAVLGHDMPERLTGDIPAPAKWVGGWFLQNTYERFESKILQRVGFDWTQLSENEELWLKGIDAIEFFLACLDQEQFGNSTLVRPKEAIVKYINKRKDEWPDELWKFWIAVKESDWQMCPEIGEQDGVCV